MTNTFYKRLVAISFLLIPALTFAQADESSVFGLPKTDPTLRYLGQVFGTVGGGVHGTSGQLLGTLFKYFNLGILAVAGVFLIWTTVKIVMETSAEGSFMGKGGKASFNIIRTILGLGLLAPNTTTGYSVIQVMLMWAVVQGAGFANTLWNKSLDWFGAGGQVFVQPSTDLQTVVALTGSVMESQVCMYYHEKMYNDLRADAQKQIKLGNTSPIYQQRASQSVAGFQPYINTANNTVNFPSGLGNKQTDNGCGTISWAQPNSANNSIAGNALLSVIQTNASAARHIANPSASDVAIIDQATGKTRLEDDVTGALVAAAADWTNLLLPLRAQTQDPNTQKAFFTDARKAGWILAGSYYYRLTSIQRNLISAANVKINIASPPVCINATSSGTYYTFPLVGVQPQCIVGIVSTFQNSVSIPQLDVVYNRVGNYAAKAQTLAMEISQANAQIPTPYVKGAGSAGFADLILSPLTGAVQGVLQTMFNPGDPVLKLMTMGHDLMEAVFKVWVMSAVVMFVLSALASLMSSIQSMGYAIRDAVAQVNTMLGAILIIVFVLGGTCSSFVPLIPFIIYTFTVLGWFIIVIEAMVAAPLVALGITHPEGHDFLGKAEQVVMLVLSVFLRPALMVIGLIAGMLLSNVMLNVLNFGYVNTVSSTMSLLGFVATFTVYVGLVVKVMTQSYGLIYMVPDRVMKWIGTGVETPQGAGAAEALAGAEKAAGEGAQALGQAGQGLAKAGAASAAEAGGELGDKAKEALSKRMKSSKAGKGGKAGGKAGGPKAGQHRGGGGGGTAPGGGGGAGGAKSGAAKR